MCVFRKQDSGITPRSSFIQFNSSSHQKASYIFYSLRILYTNIWYTFYRKPHGQLRTKCFCKLSQVRLSFSAWMVKVSISEEVVSENFCIFPNSVSVVTTHKNYNTRGKIMRSNYYYISCIMNGTTSWKVSSPRMHTSTLFRRLFQAFAGVGSWNPTEDKPFWF